MSILIELSEATERLTLEQTQPDNFVNFLKQVLAFDQFELKHFAILQNLKHAKSYQILAIIGKSPQTFIRDMEWKFYLLSEQIRIKIKFFNQNRQNFLKVPTQRMKLELMILLRSINQRLSAQEQFVVNPSDNLLEYHFRITWRQYKVKIPKMESLKRFLHYLIIKIRNFQEIIYFCEPQIQTNNDDQMSKRLHLLDDFFKVTNNYRTILRNTTNMRKLNCQYIGRMHQLKQYKPNNQAEQVNLRQEFDQVRTLFQQNINKIYQNSIGLQKNAQNEQINNKCLSNIAYHQNFKDKNNQQPGKNIFSLNPEDKIVYGIDVVKSDKQKVISKQGAHSQITRGVFLFRLVNSIDCDVIKEDPNRWLMGTQRKTELTVKRCNYESQASKNSFMNQLYFLNYVRDFHSSFIGKYYLQMKTFLQRNQKDPIYMKSYYQNVDYVVRKCQTLSIKDRLSLLYRISLGLCFLAAKNIIHRDFKPHNIVVNSALTPHIIDFGSCCSTYGSNTFTPYDKRLLTTKFIHVYYHQIPEQHHYIYEKMSKDEYEQHPLFDVYSFGRMICFVMFGSLQPPHYEQIAQDVHADLLKNIIFIIEMCLCIDPDDRPGIGQVTGFLGSLSKFYTTYQQYFLSKTTAREQKRSHSSPKQSN